jgi:uncharacterized protein YbbC (DUF1343 family)
LVTTPVFAKKTKKAAKSSPSDATKIFFREDLKRLDGKETCFITNASGLGRLFFYDAMEDTGKYIRDRLAAAEVTVKQLFTPEHGLTAQEENHGNTRTKAGDPETIYRTVLNRILRSNQCYWISVYFEAKTIEEGRITKDPFCQIGHPNFANRELPIMGGVKFQPYPFYAAGGKHKGKLLPGYKLQFGETAVNPTRAAYEFLLWHVKNGKDGFMKKWLVEKQGLDAQTGTTSCRAALIQGLSYEAWLAKEKKHIAEFRAAMQKYRLYK